MIGVRTAAGLRQVAAIGFVDAASAHRNVSLIRMITTKSKTVFGAFAASASPNYASGSAVGSHTVPVNTSSTTVSASGGVAPYTYSWATVDSGWTVSNPSGATVFFTKTVPVNTDYFTTYVCTVTDATGASVPVDVAVTVSNMSYS